MNLGSISVALTFLPPPPYARHH